MMRRMIVLLSCVWVLIWWVGCPAPPEGEGSNQEQVTSEGLQQEASSEAKQEATVDAGTTEPQAEPAPDQSRTDTNTPDPQAPDVPTTDNKPADNGPADTGTPDNGPADTGLADKGTTDTTPDQSTQDSGTPDTSSCPLPEDCATIEANFKAELNKIQQCSQDSDCGQVLAGTSCGCTRNKVANKSADLSCFEALKKQAQAKSCSLGLGSTCDCPAANGYKCVNQQCTWNYTNNP